MKKMTRYLGSAILMAAIVFTTSAGKVASAGGGDFEGVITYEICYMKDGQAVENAMFPKKQDVYIKGQMVCTDIATKASTSRGIINMQEHSSVVLIEAMGQKLALTIDNQEQMEKLADNSPEATITETGETREIAGYQCTVAMVEYPDGESYEICYTDEISVPNINMNNEMSQVDGFMLQYVKYEPKQGMYITYTATNVEEKAVDGELFVVPDGYTKMNLLDFKGIK